VQHLWPQFSQVVFDVCAATGLLPENLSLQASEQRLKVNVHTVDLVPLHSESARIMQKLLEGSQM